MLIEPDRSYTSQIVPFIVTIFTSFLTVRYLYTITNQKSLLTILFLIIYIIISWIRKYVKETLFPEHKHIDTPAPSETTPVINGGGGAGTTSITQVTVKPPIQKIYLMTFLDILLSVIVVILSTLIFDIFRAFIAKVTFRWFDYIVVMSLTILFALSFILSY